MNVIQKDRQVVNQEIRCLIISVYHLYLDTESKRKILICDLCLFSFTFNVISTELAVTTHTQDNDVLGLWWASLVVHG